MTPIIDFSASFGPARHQHDRPTCLAFAVSDAHAHARKSTPEQFSAEYIFYCAASRMLPDEYWEGITLDAVSSALHADGQPLEIAYPYLENLAAVDPLPVPKLPASCIKHFGGAVGFAGGIKDLTLPLSRGEPLVLIVRLTAAFQRAHGTDPVINFVDGALERGLHAVVAVGTGVNANNETCIKIRNSWGAGWGHQGHAWLHSEYINNHLDSIISVK